eukprot:TRINITY_DN50415_c0_g1_i1.p2 TRINITY_DN50415_c0_g1~~TRINITY_DN50415_c0_g1_i1.p2  ORF type:complete len:414 (+),score=168.84 TRINITY_DN50415_c0_g1_i1:74-1243(+)
MPATARAPHNTPPPEAGGGSVLVWRHITPAQLGSVLRAESADERRMLLERHLPLGDLAVASTAYPELMMPDTLHVLEKEGVATVLRAAGPPLEQAAQAALAKGVDGAALADAALEPLLDTLGVPEGERPAAAAPLRRLRSDPAYLDLLLNGGTEFRERVDILLDLFCSVLGFCRSSGLSPDGTAALISITLQLHDLSMRDRLDELGSRKLLAQMLATHSTQAPPFSVRIFCQEERAAIAEFMGRHYFAHYDMYVYAFTAEQQADVAFAFAHDAAPRWAVDGAEGSGCQVPPVPRPLREAMDEGEWAAFDRARRRKQELARGAVCALLAASCATAAVLDDQRTEDSGLRRQLKQMRQEAQSSTAAPLAELQRKLRGLEEQLPPSSRQGKR